MASIRDRVVKIGGDLDEWSEKDLNKVIIIIGILILWLSLSVVSSLPILVTDGHILLKSIYIGFIISIYTQILLIRIHGVRNASLWVLMFTINLALSTFMFCVF